VRREKETRQKITKKKKLSVDYILITIKDVLNINEFNKDDIFL